MTEGRKEWNGYSWYFLPRGRVRKTENENVSKRKHEIIFSDVLAVPGVIKKIKDVFELGYDEIRIRRDSSGEYDCVLYDKE